MSRARAALAIAAVLLVAALAGCSTGVQEADRAIFATACSGVTGATDTDCACAFDELKESGGSDRLVDQTLDDLRQGRAPERLTRAIARCAAP